MASVHTEFNLEGRRIAVTGATGFIGRSLCAELSRSGAIATALLRNRHGQDLLSLRNIKAVVAPLVPGQALIDAMSGHDTFINLAYDIRSDADTNLRAFEAALSAARQVGVKQIIHMSSVVVYDDWPDGGSRGSISESSSIGSAGSHGYRAAKIEMENRLRAQAIPTTILQPTIVYGPASEQWTLAQFHALRSGGIVLPDPCGECALVHVDDVVQALLRAATVVPTATDHFLISGPESIGWDTLLSGYARIIGAPPPLKVPANELLRRSPVRANEGHKAPSPAARVGSALRQMIGRQRFDLLKSRLIGLTGSSGPAWPDPSQLALYSARPLINISHACYALGYKPTVTFKQGLETLLDQPTEKTNY